MPTKLTFKQSIQAGVMAAVAAATINAVLFFIFHAAGFITDDLHIQLNQPMTVLPVIMSSVLPSLVASIVFFLFERYTDKGFKYFSILSIILLILSFANPFLAIVGVTIPYAIALNVMHVVVVLALLYFIGKAVRANS